MAGKRQRKENKSFSEQLSELVSEAAASGLLGTRRKIVEESRKEEMKRKRRRSF